MKMLLFEVLTMSNMHDNQDRNILPVLPPLRLRRLPDELWVRQLTPLSPADVALEVIDQTAALVRRARELRALAEDLAVAWIERNGDLVCGTIRYYAGHRSVTRCIAPRQAVELLLDAVGGDLEQFAALLASSAFRYGTCRCLLPPEQYADVFLTEKRINLREGRVRKRLLMANEQFWPRVLREGGAS